MQDKYTLISGIFFGIVAVLQALRALNRWTIQIESISIPVWFSWVAMVVAGGMCVWAFATRRR